MKKISAKKFLPEKAVKIRNFFFLAACLPLNGCASNEITNLGRNLLANLCWSLIFGGLVAVVIFAMNKYITKDGRTHDKLCSIIGVMIFPLIFMAGIGIKFGFTLWPMLIAAILGGFIGWFSYTIDEMFGDFWHNKEIVIPAVLGIVMAGYMTTALFTHVWLEGDMYITNKACVKRAVLERYTYNSCTNSKGEDCSSYSWEYLTHRDKAIFGWELPKMAEGQDYPERQMSSNGYFRANKLDRVRWEQYYFIGGHLFSERLDDWKNFEWLLLASGRIDFKEDEVQRVQSNYFGNPFNNAGIVQAPKILPEKITHTELPGKNDLPPATSVGKIANTSWTATKLLFEKDEYRILLWLHLAFGSFLAFLAIFFPSLRMSIWIFVIFASIIILLIFLAIASKTGGTNIFKGQGSGDRRYRDRGWGKGESGGGGYSGRL
jgi:uncharacterized membrane protein